MIFGASWGPQSRRLWDPHHSAHRDPVTVHATDGEGDRKRQRGRNRDFQGLWAPSLVPTSGWVRMTILTRCTRN